MRQLCIGTLIVAILTSCLIVLINLISGPLTNYVIGDILLWFVANFITFLAMLPMYAIVYGNNNTQLK